MSASVQVFGRRQQRNSPHAHRAGVQKAPRHEVAGSWAAAGKLALWGLMLAPNSPEPRRAGRLWPGQRALYIRGPQLHPVTRTGWTVGDRRRQKRLRQNPQSGSRAWPDGSASRALMSRGYGLSDCGMADAGEFFASCSSLPPENWRWVVGHGLGGANYAPASRCPGYIKYTPTMRKGARSPRRSKLVSR